MLRNRAWSSRHSKAGILVRIGLALFSILTSITITWLVLGGVQLAAHASTNTRTIHETTLPSSQPWGVGFDKLGNIWVAEPGCDFHPVCDSSFPANIALYNRKRFSLVHNYAEPAGFSNPLFVALDASNNVWFTEPNTNAIGELIRLNGKAQWNQWTVPTANAAPYDLTIAKAGNIWFTERLANKIGELNITTHQITETATPTGSSSPYGITGPDPSTGSIWFTENNSAIARIGRFTPPTGGTPLTTSAISEYPTPSPTSNTTLHLITFDKFGNVWWSEGFAGKIGKLVISQAVNGKSNGITEYNVPNCQYCGTHISGIGVDSTGTVWFDDSLEAKVGSYVPSSNTFTMYTVGGGNINAHPHDGLAVDNKNVVWFTEQFANALGELV